jgi:hypothetical protein
VKQRKCKGPKLCSLSPLTGWRVLIFSSDSCCKNRKWNPDKNLTSRIFSNEDFYEFGPPDWKRAPLWTSLVTAVIVIRSVAEKVKNLTQMFSETSVIFCQTTPHDSPEDSVPQNHCSQKLLSWFNYEYSGAKHCSADLELEVAADRLLIQRLLMIFHFLKKYNKTNHSHFVSQLYQL